MNKKSFFLGVQGVSSSHLRGFIRYGMGKTKLRGKRQNPVFKKA